MNEATVRELLVCPACRRGMFTAIPFELDGDDYVNAVLACRDCRAWYRVEDRLPILLSPRLRDRDRDRSFRARFLSRWDGWDAPAGSADCTDSPGDARKRESIMFFQGVACRYDRGIADSPFWNAFDLGFHRVVRDRCPARGMLVEIGGGTGRFSLPLAGMFRSVLSFDLSEEMAREAMAKVAMARVATASAASGRRNNTAFFVADAENIPVRSGTADCALFSGVLTYLPSQDIAVAEAARILTAGGTLVGQENNASLLRPCFDLLMRLSGCWTAKSYPQRAFISRARLDRWLKDAGMDAGIWTEVFLPPHLFNLLSAQGARRLMHLTNVLGRSLPWVGTQGGLLLFTGTKAGTPS